MSGDDFEAACDTLRANFAKLHLAGITPARWIALRHADEAAMQRLVQAWPKLVSFPSASQDAQLINHLLARRARRSSLGKTSLPPADDLFAAFLKLEKTGIITSARWIALRHADDAAMRRLAAAWPEAPEPEVVIPQSTDIVYTAADVSRVLGIPVTCNEPVPQIVPGEIIVYYGGWDLKQLRTCPAGKQRMWQEQDWYEKYGWKAEPGYYRLLLPVPGSNGKTWSEQLQLLATIDAAWQLAPVCVAATALLVHLTETGDDLLNNDWCRCAEALPDDNHALLAVGEGRVLVSNDRDGDRYDDVWGSASRKC